MYFFRQKSSDSTISIGFLTRERCSETSFDNCPDPDKNYRRIERDAPAVLALHLFLENFVRVQLRFGVKNNALQQFLVTIRQTRNAAGLEKSYIVKPQTLQAVL